MQSKKAVLSGCENKREFVKQKFMLIDIKYFAHLQKKMNKILLLAIYSENKLTSNYAHGWRRNNATEIVNNMRLYLNIKRTCLSKF